MIPLYRAISSYIPSCISVCLEFILIVCKKVLRKFEYKVPISNKPINCTFTLWMGTQICNCVSVHSRNFDWNSCRHASASASCACLTGIVAAVQFFQIFDMSNQIKTKCEIIEAWRNRSRILWILIYFKTRKHFRRMRTARFSDFGGGQPNPS